MSLDDFDNDEAERYERHRLEEYLRLSQMWQVLPQTEKDVYESRKMKEERGPSFSPFLLFYEDHERQLPRPSAEAHRLSSAKRHRYADELERTWAELPESSKTEFHLKAQRMKEVYDSARAAYKQELDAFQSSEKYIRTQEKKAEQSAIRSMRSQHQKQSIADAKERHLSGLVEPQRPACASQIHFHEHYNSVLAAVPRGRGRCSAAAQQLHAMWRALTSFEKYEYLHRANLRRKTFDRTMDSYVSTPGYNAYRKAFTEIVGEKATARLQQLDAWAASRPRRCHGCQGCHDDKECISVWHGWLPCRPIPKSSVPPHLHNAFFPDEA